MYQKVSSINCRWLTCLFGVILLVGCGGGSNPEDAPIGTATPVANDVAIATREDEAISGKLDASGTNGDLLTFEIVAQPNKGTVELTDATTGIFLYTPAANANGNDFFTYRARNNTAESTPANVTITIQAINDVPNAVADSFEVTKGKSLLIANLAANDVDVDGDSLSVMEVTQPSNGVLFDNNDSSYTYTPTIDFIGDDGFSYIVDDGHGAIATGDVTIRVKQASQSALQPIILYTDIIAGPNSGGENNNGAYLTLFGLGFGEASNLGTTTKVFIKDVEVSDYKYFGLAFTQFLGSAKPIQMISIQVGALGNPTPGTELPIKLVVDGQTSNTDHTFAVQPGDMVYVSKAGSDTSGDGSFENPYRLVQNPSKSNPAWNSWGPGDTIVLREGTWQDIGADHKFLRIDSSKDGSAPDGSAGNGYMTIMGYPGEVVTVNVQYSSGSSNGGIVGPGSGFNDKANYVAIANLIVNDDATKEFGDGGDGPIFASASGLGWRVVNNEVTARIGAAVDQRASGIGGGYKNAFILGNYVHDIQGITSGGGPTFLNHGMYFDYDSDTVEIAYNQIEDVGSGSSMQWHGASYNGIDAHHNLLNGAGKHGFNDNGLRDSRIYNNIVMNIYQAGYRRAANNATGVTIDHNTFYNCNNSNSGSYATWYEDAWQQSAGPSFNNNIVSIVDGQNYYLNNTLHEEATTLNNNLYYGDGNGPAKDGSAINDDPVFVDANAGDFHLQSDSHAINSGDPNLSIPVLNDYELNQRGVSDIVDVGAYEYQ